MCVYICNKTSKEVEPQNRSVTWMVFAIVPKFSLEGNFSGLASRGLAHM